MKFYKENTIKKIKFTRTYV